MEDQPKPEEKIPSFSDDQKNAILGALPSALAILNAMRMVQNSENKESNDRDSEFDSDEESEESDDEEEDDIIVGKLVEAHEALCKLVLERSRRRGK